MADGDGKIEKTSCEIVSKHKPGPSGDNLDSLSLDVLNEAFKLLNTRPFMLFLLKIEHCNAAYRECFSNARCYTTKYTRDGNVVLYPFMNIFESGKHVLKTYIEKKELPREKGAKIALENLLQFIKLRSDIEKKLEVDAKVKESDWALRLVHHMLSKLSVSSTYIVDNHYQNKFSFCPCCKEELRGDFGDTSIGNNALWHGNIDIFLGKSVAIKVADLEEEEADVAGNVSSIEVKQDYSTDHDNQLLAETIVFSFVQKKYHPGYDNYLFPTIALSKTELIVTFYDSEHDTLIKSAPLRLMDRGLNMQTVVALWLTINYKYFCSGITLHMKENNYKANFFNQVGEKINIYERNVKFGCGCGTRKEKFDPGTSFKVDVIEEDVPLKKPRLL